MSAIDAGERFISNRFKPRSERSEPQMPPYSMPRERISMRRPEIIRSSNPRRYRPRPERRYDEIEKEAIEPRRGIFGNIYGKAKSSYGTAKKAGETYYEIKSKYNAARQLFTDIQHERRHKKIFEQQRNQQLANTTEALKDLEGVKYQEL